MYLVRVRVNHFLYPVREQCYCAAMGQQKGPAKRRSLYVFQINCAGSNLAWILGVRRRGSHSCRAAILESGTCAMGERGLSVAYRSIHKKAADTAEKAAMISLQTGFPASEDFMAA